MAQKEALELAISGAALEAALDVLTRTAREHGGEGARTAMFIVDGDRLRLGAAAGLSPAYLRAVDGCAMGVHCAPPGGTPAVVRDVSRDPRWADYLDLAREHGIRACCSCPIRSTEGELLGALAVYYATAFEPGPGDLEPVERLAETAALVIGRRQGGDPPARGEAGDLGRSAQIRRLAQAVRRINAAHDVASALDTITEEARGLVGAHQCVTSLTVDGGGARAINAASLSEQYAAWKDYEGRTDGPVIHSLVCPTNEPMRMTQAELEAHPAWTDSGEEAGKHPPMRGWLAVPLIGVDGRNLGLIQLSDRYHGDFTEDDEAILVQLAEMAATAIENARLFESTRKEIAERKEAEAALATLSAASDRRKRLYETILASTPDLIVVFDLDYRFTFANEALLQMWGRTLEECIGKRLPEIGYEPWLATMHERELDRVVATKQPVRGEVPFDHATLGRRTYDYIFVPVIDAGGEVEAIAGTTRDITDRENARDERERRLREVQAEQRQLAEVFQNAPSFMCILRGPEHVFERTNELYRELIGYRDVIGKPVREAFPDVEGQGVFDLLDPVYQTGETYVGNDVPIALRSATGDQLDERWLNFVYQPIRDPEGAVTGIYVQGVDLTDRKRAEQALRESEQRLKDANALLEQRVAERTAEIEQRADDLRRLNAELNTVEQRERRELAQTLHDNLQQVLAVAKMKVGMALDQTSDEHIGAWLHQAMEHVDETIEGMRTIATELSPPMLYYDGLAPTLQWLIRRLGEDHGLRVELHADDLDVAISHDLRALVFQAIRELSFNIVKHAETDRARIELSTVEPPGYLSATVEDFGKGCDPETITRKPEHGFGLASIRERLNGLGGAFDVQGSSASGGLRVTMRIPLGGSPEK